MLLLSRAVALVGRDELGPFDFCFVAVPQVCTVASSRKQGNSVRALSLHCCVASIARVVFIIGWHVCVRSRVIDLCFRCTNVFFGRARCVSSFVVASRLRRLIVLIIFFYCTLTSLIFIDRLISLVDLFRSTFSTNLAIIVGSNRQTLAVTTLCLI